MVSWVTVTNIPFKQWASIFNNDSTIASAALVRLLHHAEAIVIEWASYLIKDQLNPQETVRSRCRFSRRRDLTFKLGASALSLLHSRKPTIREAFGKLAVPDNRLFVVVLGCFGLAIFKLPCK